MTSRFGRRIRATLKDQLVAGDYKVGEEPLAIHIMLRKDMSGWPPEGTVSFYNLAPGTEARFHEPGQDLLVEAGYTDDIGVIFDGDIRRVWREREGLNRVTRVAVGGISFDKRELFTFARLGEVQIREIIREAIASVEGAVAGSLNAILPSWTEKDFSFAGDPLRCISKLLESRPITWYEEDRTIKFTSIPDTDVLDINENTGLIGSPIQTDRGIDVRTTLNWRAKLNARVNLDLELPGIETFSEGSGLWRVGKVMHSGSNREGPFETRLECWAA